MNQGLPSVPTAVRTLWKLPLENQSSFQVYQNVPLQNLIPSGRKRPEIDRRLEHLCFLYLLCQGSTVHLAVASPSAFDRLKQKALRLDDVSIPGLLIVKGLQSARYHDAIRYKLADLEEKTGHLSKPAWQYRPHVIAKRDQDCFRRKRLLENWYNPDVPLSEAHCRPTDYGWAMGLSAGYTMDGNGTIRCDAICSTDRIAQLKRPLISTHTQSTEKIPLELRLQRIKEGLPGDPGHSVRIARQMADITLKEYTSELPQDLPPLLEALSRDTLEADGDFTLQKAAGIISCLYQSPFPDEKAKAQDALFYLARSIEYAYRKRRVNQ